MFTFNYFYFGRWLQFLILTGPIHFYFLLFTFPLARHYKMLLYQILNKKLKRAHCSNKEPTYYKKPWLNSRYTYKFRPIRMGRPTQIDHIVLPPHNKGDNLRPGLYNFSFYYSKLTQHRRLQCVIFNHFWTQNKKMFKGYWHSDSIQTMVLF